MNEFILYTVMTFTAVSGMYNSDVAFSTDATYQHPFESLESCEAAAPREKLGMLTTFIRFPVKDLDIQHTCLPTEGQKL